MWYLRRGKYVNSKSVEKWTFQDESYEEHVVATMEDAVVHLIGRRSAMRFKKYAKRAFLSDVCVANFKGDSSLRGIAVQCSDYWSGAPDSWRRVLFYSQSHRSDQDW